MRETITRQFTFNHEVMNVCYFNDQLHVDDADDNSIVINGVKKSELIYLFRNFFCSRDNDFSKLDPHHRAMIREVKEKLTRILGEEG